MKKYQDHELCESIITWSDDYPGVDISYVGTLYESVCNNKPLRVDQRSYLIKFIDKYKIDVDSYLV